MHPGDNFWCLICYNRWTDAWENTLALSFQVIMLKSMYCCQHNDCYFWTCTWKKQWSQHLWDDIGSPRDTLTFPTNNERIRTLNPQSPTFAIHLNASFPPFPLRRYPCRVLLVIWCICSWLSSSRNHLLPSWCGIPSTYDSFPENKKNSYSSNSWFTDVIV